MIKILKTISKNLLKNKNKNLIIIGSVHRHVAQICMCGCFRLFIRIVIRKGLTNALTSGDCE